MRGQGGYLPPGDQLALRAAMARLAANGGSAEDPAAGRSRAMTLGITCTVILGLIALHQAWSQSVIGPR